MVLSCSGCNSLDIYVKQFLKHTEATKEQSVCQYLGPRAGKADRFLSHAQQVILEEAMSAIVACLGRRKGTTEPACYRKAYEAVEK